MKKLVLATMITLAAAAAFAQGKFTWVDSMTDDKDKILPGVNPALVSGAIITAGSSTVFPLSEAIAERFAKDGYKGQIAIDSIGTGGGFERFAKTGETDIANASRAITAKGITQAAALSPPRTPLELRVGTDALAVVVSAKNSFATARHIAAPKSVELMTVLRGDGRFRANAGRMEQALFNLAENAIRYSPAGGIVRIEYDGDGQTAVFTVRDQGPGIPAADLPRIFERFYRADKSRDRKSGGTGLGLAIVRHIALSHGGDVEAESWAGEGSAFRIRIPRDPAPRP